MLNKFIDKFIPETHVFCNAYNESTCMDGITCIDRNFICDGRPQCPDSSDEFSCSINKKCQPNQFMCRNGKCVAKFWRCDGENDCGDNSDEESCGQTPVSGPCKYEIYIEFIFIDLLNNFYYTEQVNFNVEVVIAFQNLSTAIKLMIAPMEQMK